MMLGDVGTFFALAYVSTTEHTVLRYETWLSIKSVSPMVFSELGDTRVSKIHHILKLHGSDPGYSSICLFFAQFQPAVNVIAFAPFN